MKKNQPPKGSLISRMALNQVIRKGVNRFSWGDLYHLLLVLSWPQFLLAIFGLYIVSNILFAFLYLAGGDCIANARPGSFPDAFFFSVQTMATIGYGGMSPQTSYANAIVTIEALIGLLGVAMVTGLAFARFSLPSARLLFSKVAVIAPHNGIPTLMFRTANQRRNFVLEAEIRVTLVRNETTTEGQFMRRFYDLELVRSRTPIFALSWMVMHPITEKSLLYGVTPDSLVADEMEIIVTLTGIDETVSQTIHSRYSYTSQEILWNAHFVDIISKQTDGRRVIDYTRFHDWKIYRS
jgi:inward rectifier potassium channel